MTKEQQAELAQHPTGSNNWYAAMYRHATPSGQRIIANTLAARHNGWRTEFSADGTRQWYVGADGNPRP